MNGKCPQCYAQIMVQDVNGRWNSRKKNFGQAYIHFKKVKIKTLLCTECAKSPDAKKIMSEVLNEKSILDETKASLGEEAPERIESI